MMDGHYQRIIDDLPLYVQRRLDILPPDRLKRTLDFIDGLKKQGLNNEDIRKECLDNIKRMDTAGTDRILLAGRKGHSRIKIPVNIKGGDL